MLCSHFFARKIKIMGEVEGYLRWLNLKFSTTKLVRRRETLWNFMIKNMSSGRWVVYEFGVAWGYTTQYFLSKNIQTIERWHGFDRFTGLPRAWRDVGKGEFDAGGRTPNIEDSRIEWHVGNVEDTFSGLEIEKCSKCIIFDLDIYEPTLFAWKRFSENLLPGDLIYFDEAYDSDERKILEEEIIPNAELELIGSTVSALVVRYLGRKSC